MKKLKIEYSNTFIDAGKIICVGRNYAEHAAEMKAEVPTSPVLFLKPPSALLEDGKPIIRPSISQSMHHEVELVVVIGAGGSAIPESEARAHVLGYAVGLDMTLRDVQSAAKAKGLPWTIAKGFDTSAPISPVIPADRVPDPGALRIRCLVNGMVRQKASIGEMIFPVERLIAYISSIFTLERGDLIYTGTPEGVGEVGEGDILTAELEGLTSISHPVHVR